MGQNDIILSSLPMSEGNMAAEESRLTSRSGGTSVADFGGDNAAEVPRVGSKDAFCSLGDASGEKVAEKSTDREPEDASAEL